MRRDEYWNLFWLSGMPEAWMMSRAGWDELRSTDLISRTVPDSENQLPEEAKQLYQSKGEQGTAEAVGPFLSGE